MNKKLLILVPIIIGLIGSQIYSLSNNNSSNLTLDPPQTVPYVNLTRYIGTWYEQASIPASFSKDCLRSMAQYSFNPNGTIRVNNTCQRSGVRGGIIGYAYPDPEDKETTNSKLLVQFPQNPNPGNYWIVRLDEDYTYVVVSTPDYRDLWILYRKPTMSDQQFQSIYQDLQEDGFPVQQLKKTTQ